MVKGGAFYVVVVALAVGYLGATGAASRPQGAAPPARGVTLEVGKPLARTLKPNTSEAHDVALQSGQFLRVAVTTSASGRFWVAAMSPGGTKIREEQSTAANQALIVFPAAETGTYRLEVQQVAPDKEDGSYQIQLEEVLSPQRYQERRAALTGWAKANAIPIDGVEPGKPFSDLQRLKPLLKDARLIGFGEGAHGAHEFFQLKHRLLEFLVREMNVRVFANESSYSEAVNINDYVMGRTSDGAAAVASLNHHNWETEPMRAMIEWMRTYNASVTPDKRVRFAGFDTQNLNLRGRAEIAAYFKRAVPHLAPLAESLAAVDIAALRDSRTRATTPEARNDVTAKLEDIRGKYAQLLGFLVTNDERLARTTSRAEFDRIVEFARFAVQEMEATFNSAPNLRPEYMAATLRRMVFAEPPGTRVIYNAHNVHVSTDETVAPYPSAGYLLRQLLGNSFYSLGFTFNQGSFQQRDAELRDGKRFLRGFRTPAADQGSLESYLVQGTPKIFVIDIHTAKGPVSEWLNRYQPFRYVGGTASPRESFLYPARVGLEYDALVFVDTITRAKATSHVPDVDTTTP